MTTRAVGDLEIEPLKAGDLRGLRFLLQSRFTGDALTQHLAVNPGLSWRVPSNGQYVVGGYWRRRPEIASIVEIGSGPYRAPLIEQVVASARRIGCTLVVVELNVGPREAPAWQEVGFGPIDTIVEYEKRGTDYPPLDEGPRPRLYLPDDLRSLLELERRSFPWLWWNSSTEMIHYAESEESEIWVLPGKERDQVVGYVGLTVRGDHGHLDRLAVDPTLRRRGLGSVLVALALDRFALRGARRITLTTQFDNRRAQPLYQRFGFRQTREQLTIYGRWLGTPRDRTP
jgi:ribosomal-protein-alanine N-acetyltransferase